MKRFIERLPQVRAVPVKKIPSIYRIITAFPMPSLFAKELFVGFVCGALVVGIAMSTVRLFSSIEAYQGVLDQKKLFLQQKGYWQSVLSEYPEYRDAHFRLGALAYQEGNMAQAREEVEKAIQRDPSFIEGKTFLERIESAQK